ncbi:MAG: YkgJ family cysteine cluster protein [Desulfobacterium sp.]|nr:YkgJ family cysteine cluster protein [Desulfobacterium sp.]
MSNVSVFLSSEERISSRECRRCAECCKNIPFVELSNYEINSLAVYTGLSPWDFINSKGPNTDGFFLKIKENGYCFFLNKSDRNYSCEVYAVRPEICKNYPSNPAQNKFCKANETKNIHNNSG